MTQHLVKNGHVIDPANNIDGLFDVLISDGKIERIEKEISSAGAQIADAKGCIVAPGLVDMHTHLREPGREDEETVLTGTRAAIKGGFTSVACMPNTEPPLDNPAIIKSLKEIIKRDALCNVFIVGATTESRAGRRPTDFHKMKKEGVVAVSDDGSPIENESVMGEALQQSKEEGLLVIEHCEDKNLSASGVMNQSFTSTKLGLRGIPAASEYEAVARTIELARKVSCAVHIAHVSAARSVELIREAKRSGIKVTAETAPHYFSLSEECCVTYDTNMKMSPPLRSKDDVAAIKEGLKDGTIDVIATDHAPHADNEKDVEFDYAPFGIIGLETALGLSIMELVETKTLSMGGLITKMSLNPAKILGISAGTLTAGAAADIVIIDPKKEYTYARDSIESRSKNSPFINWTLRGKAALVFVGGRPVKL
jgi:dihydroorotase